MSPWKPRETGSHETHGAQLHVMHVNKHANSRQWQRWWSHTHGLQDPWGKMKAHKQTFVCSTIGKAGSAETRSSEGNLTVTKWWRTLSGVQECETKILQQTVWKEHGTTDFMLLQTMTQTNTHSQRLAHTCTYSHIHSQSASLTQQMILNRTYRHSTRCKWDMSDFVFELTV